MVQSGLREWKLIALGCIAGPPLLLGWMYPLVPKSIPGWFLAVGVGAVAGAWAVGGAMLIGWLQRRTRYRLLCQVAAATVAVSLGAVIFWAAYEKQTIVTTNFSYFGR